MKEDYTHILFIIDDSGSMMSLISDSIGGYNTFIEEQTKLDGEGRIDTITFGSPHNFKYLYRDMDVNEVPELTRDEHSAHSGVTALLDAIGRGIQDLGKFLREKDESDIPAKVLVNIFTDGAENSSVEFTADQVKDMIKEQTDKYNWEFAFLASDLSASNLAKSIGISNVAFTDKGSKGMRDAYTSMTLNAASYRSRGVSMDVQATYDAEKNKDEDETVTT